MQDVKLFVNKTGKQLSQCVSHFLNCRTLRQCLKEYYPAAPSRGSRETFKTQDRRLKSFQGKKKQAKNLDCTRSQNRIYLHLFNQDFVGHFDRGSVPSTAGSHIEQ